MNNNQTLTEATQHYKLQKEIEEMNPFKSGQSLFKTETTRKYGSIMDIFKQSQSPSNKHQ